MRIFLIGDAAASAHEKQKVPGRLLQPRAHAWCHRAASGHHRRVRHMHGCARHRDRGFGRRRAPQQPGRTDLMDHLGRQGAGVLNSEPTTFYRQRTATNATVSYFFGCTSIGKIGGRRRRRRRRGLVHRRGCQGGCADLLRDRHPRACRPLFPQARTCTVLDHAARAP